MKLAAEVAFLSCCVSLQCGLHVVLALLALMHLHPFTRSLVWESKHAPPQVTGFDAIDAVSLRVCDAARDLTSKCRHAPPDGAAATRRCSRNGRGIAAGIRSMKR